MLTNLRLQNFRSYQDSSFEISPGVNIIVGPNASGKTNLLEAVLVLSKGASYRAKDQELVSFDKDWLRLDGDSDSGLSRTVKITKEPKPLKTYEIDSKVYKRLSMATTLPVVLFEPNHLQLLSGGPDKRRDYLDDLLEQILPDFGRARRQYKRALSQRNSLIKHPSSYLDEQIFPWNIRLSQLAGQIVKARNQLISRFNEQIEGCYQELSQSSTMVKLVYLSQHTEESYESEMLKKLESNLDLDIQRGFTSTGPHREDITVLFNDHPSQYTASRGEVRTLVLALKITELKLIEKSRGMMPILLLDDVFSELDGSRRHSLTSYLKKYQTFITTTDADLVVQNFAQDCNIIPTQN